MTEKIETEHLLFSVVTAGEEVSATEALLSFGVFQTWDAVQPLYASNSVGKPIPVMTEGTYFLKVKQGGQEKYKEVKFSAEDIVRLAGKQPRDVPFNYDHRRAPGKEGVKGWLRFGKSGDVDLHYVGQVTTPDGHKLTALFATPELGQEAQGMVADGTYRDVSVEYRGLDDVLTGCALTSYPVMRNLQFSDLDQGESEPQPAPQDPQEEEMDITKVKELPKEQRKELLDALLGDHGLSLEGLVQMGEQFSASEARNKQTAHALALSQAEAEINSLIGVDHFGLTSEIATGAQEVLAWVSEDTTLSFGETDGAPDVAGVVKSLLGVIGKQGKQLAILGGPAEGRSEDGVEFGELDEPEVTESSVDASRVKSLSGLARSFL